MSAHDAAVFGDGAEPPPLSTEPILYAATSDGEAARRSTCVIWPILSSSDMRESRSPTRWATGSDGSRHGSARPRRATGSDGSRYGSLPPPPPPPPPLSCQTKVASEPPGIVYERCRPRVLTASVWDSSRSLSTTRTTDPSGLRKATVIGLPLPPVVWP